MISNGTNKTGKGNKMPNWVYSDLTAEGNKEDIIKLKKHVGEPYTRPFTDYVSKDGELVRVAKETTFNNPVFSFWNIIKPEDIHAYIFEEDTPIPDNYDQAEGWFTGNGWYDWNVRNWGTKWDVANVDGEAYLDTELIDETDNSIHYKFQTAWAPAVKAIGWLSKQYPSLKFTLDYQEETGWGGQVEFIDGTMEEKENYGWKCGECDNMEDETPWCDDCNTDMCPKCNYGEPTEECEKHKEYV